MVFSKSLERFVKNRAQFRCEYCLFPENWSDLPFAIDHIVARQHRGRTRVENLAFSCGTCNRHKGPNIAGIDPVSKQLTRLFNPRIDQWQDHFEYRGAVIKGRTAIGRTSVVVFDMNRLSSRLARQSLLQIGSLPRK